MRAPPLPLSLSLQSSLCPIFPLFFPFFYSFSREYGEEEHKRMVFLELLSLSMSRKILALFVVQNLNLCLFKDIFK